MRVAVTSASVLLAATAVSAANVDPATLDACPGYNATDVATTESGLAATLSLAGPACNVFGNDIETLQLNVTYETGRHQSHFCANQFVDVAT